MLIKGILAMLLTIVGSDPCACIAGVNGLVQNPITPEYVHTPSVIEILSLTNGKCDVHCPDIEPADCIFKYLVKIKAKEGQEIPELLIRHGQSSAGLIWDWVEVLRASDTEEVIYKGTLIVDCGKLGRIQIMAREHGEQKYHDVATRDVVCHGCPGE